MDHRAMATVLGEINRVFHFEEIVLRTITGPFIAKLPVQGLAITFFA